MDTSNLRIAWLLPSAVLYWQPLLSEFAKLFPKTTVFTALWRGFIQGFENTFVVEVVGQRQFVQVGATAAHYKSGAMYLSPQIVNRLLQAKPNVIFTNSFGLWTILALLFKPLGSWRVVIAYEGSSPGVDYRDSALRTWLRKQLVKQSDALLTNSEAGRQYLLHYLEAEDSKVFQKPYEVPDTRILQRAQIAELKSCQQPVFVYVGQVIERKDLRSLLQACTLLESQGHQTYSLLVVGDGEQRPELEAYCVEKRLQDRVQWLGKVPYEQVGAYLNAADVFVLPTLEDTWGMVVLEAMMLGKAVVCSNGAGAAELITDGQNGYRFQPQDVEALATAMKHFIANPDLARSMGEASRQVMAQHNPAAAAQFLSEVACYTLNK